MNSAQIQGLIRQILTIIGTLAAGTSFAHYFDSTYVEAFVGVVGSIVVAVSVIWSHKSNTAIASAQKLVSDPAVSNTQAASAIAAGKPEDVKS